MPTPHKTLGISDANVQKKKELTPYTRGLIVGAAQSGLSATGIAEQFNLPRSTVSTTLLLRLNSIRDEGLSRARSGNQMHVLIARFEIFYDIRSYTHGLLFAKPGKH